MRGRIALLNVQASFAQPTAHRPSLAYPGYGSAGDAGGIKQLDLGEQRREHRGMVVVVPDTGRGPRVHVRSASPVGGQSCPVRSSLQKPGSVEIPALVCQPPIGRYQGHQDERRWSKEAGQACQERRYQSSHPNSNPMSRSGVKIRHPPVQHRSPRRRRRHGTETGKAWPRLHGPRLFAAVPRPISRLAVAGSVPRTDDHSQTSQAAFRTNGQPQPVQSAPSIFPHETAANCCPVSGLHLFSLICTASSSDFRPAVSRSFVDPARRSSPIMTRARRGA